MRSLLFQRGIVVEGELIHVDLDSLVEKDRSARLPLEVDEEHLVGALGHPQNFELDLGSLDHGHEVLMLLFFSIVGALLVLRLLIDLLFALKVDLPDVVGDLIGLVLDLQVLRQLR